MVTPFWVVTVGLCEVEADIEDDPACGVQTTAPVLESDVEKAGGLGEDPPCGVYTVGGFEGVAGPLPARGV